jgi:hypothetical protein
MNGCKFGGTVIHLSIVQVILGQKKNVCSNHAIMGDINSKRTKFILEVNFNVRSCNCECNLCLIVVSFLQRM